jgi:hypothetical protein
MADFLIILINDQILGDILIIQVETEEMEEMVEEMVVQEEILIIQMISTIRSIDTIETLYNKDMTPSVI